MALGLIAVVATIAAASFVVVDETEFKVVTSFGRVVVVYGDEPGETGLHFKAPWHLALPIDRRVRVFEPPPREVITGDKRNLEVASYVVWRVAEPVLFVRNSGTHELAEARLYERISAGQSDVIGRRDLSALASVDPGRWDLDALTRELAGAVAPAARSELGVDVIDVRIRRFNHPIEVRPAVFELIKSERRQVAARLRAEGEAQSTKITSQADRERDTILAQADAEAERIRGGALAEATRVLNEAHAHDPKFFEFMSTLEAYRAIFDGQATVVLSSTSPILKLLAQGPAADRGAESAAERAPVRNATGQP
jgi:membrane protease subunit HflC